VPDNEEIEVMNTIKQAVLTMLCVPAVVALALGLSACSQPAEAPAEIPAPVMEPAEDFGIEAGEGPMDDHADHDHDHDADEDHGEHDDDHGHEHDDDSHSHHHEAPRGGTLIALGDHMGHFEMLLDAERGTLTIYALDGHAEHPVRLEAESFDLTLRLPDGEEIEVSLAAVANPLTGETAGDTSQFEAQDERLQGLSAFQVMFPAFEFRGIDVPAMDVPFPEGNE